MKNKWLIASLSAITLLLIGGCSANPFNSTKTYPSINLPYEIVDEEVEEIKKDGLEEYTDKQTLREVRVRELTTEENKRFSERMEYNTLQDLNTEYSAVEFDFGNTNRIYTNEKSFLKFDEDDSYFIYNDEILNNKFYQIPSYKDRKALYLKNNEKIYGYIYDDLKIIVLIKNNFVEKGLQFKTRINDEVIYIDIK